MIRITGKKDGENIIFKVHDNGKGMTEEKLFELRSNMRKKKLDNNVNSFGVINVNQRLRHYYGKEYGLSYVSRQDEGTEVTVLVKAENIQPFT